MTHLDINLGNAKNSHYISLTYIITKFYFIIIIIKFDYYSLLSIFVNDNNIYFSYLSLFIWKIKSSD